MREPYQLQARQKGNPGPRQAAIPVRLRHELWADYQLFCRTGVSFVAMAL